MGRGANSTPPREESGYEGTLLYLMLLAKYTDSVLELTPHPRGQSFGPTQGFSEAGLPAAWGTSDRAGSPWPQLFCYDVSPRSVAVMCEVS